MDKNSPPKDDPSKKSDATTIQNKAGHAEAKPKEDQKEIETIYPKEDELPEESSKVPEEKSQKPTKLSRFKKKFSLSKEKNSDSSEPKEIDRRENFPHKLDLRRKSSTRKSSISEDSSVQEVFKLKHDSERRKSTLRSFEFIPGGLDKRVSISDPDADAQSTRFSTVSDISKPSVTSERPSVKVYNPFESFERRVTLSNPQADTSDKKSIYSETPRTGKSISETVETWDRPPRKSSITAKRKSVSVVDLTKMDVAICFFPEEPDWDDDDDDDEDEDYPVVFSPKRERSDSIFPDPKTTYDWNQRERWQSRLVYLIALVTYSMSFSNIYHFPVLVYHYGGIPFLIPYTIFTIILGYPLHFLESSLGQYSQSGPVRVWDAAPIARGIGWSMFFLGLMVAYYYNMYAAYSVIYFARCFNAILPWQDCDEPAISNYSCVPRMCARPNSNHNTPAEHYFFHHVLQILPSAEILGNGLGPMVWTQVVGFLLAWILVYAAIIHSVRSIGKVVFVLVILPYFVLLMLLTAGLMLQGSSRGLKLLFATNFEHLLDIQIWRVAAEQVFFELGICQGTPLAYGSYCHHRNPTHIDSAIICVINYFTSLLCATVIFLILGALAIEIGAPVSDVIQQGPGLVFIAYPEALSRVPGSKFWCIMFFLMLFSVCIGTQIAIAETVMTVVYDEFPNARPYRWLINLLICCCLFTLGIVLCTCNGYFVVHLLDRTAGTMPRLPIAVCMVGTIVLIYGISKYCEDVHFMLGYYPNLFVRLCLLITPFMLLALTIPSWVLKKPLRALNHNYSDDAIMVGWFLIWFILIWIVLGAVYWCVYCCYIGQLKDVWRSLNSWGPRNFEARVARTEFSSEEVSNFTRPWRKTVRIET